MSEPFLYLVARSMLLLFWTVLAVLFGLFALWKYLKPRESNNQRISSRQTSENMKEARLKFFAGREEVLSRSTMFTIDSSSDTPAHVRTNDSVSEERNIQKERQKKTVDAGQDIEAPEPSVRYTKLIEGPRKVGSSALETENSPFDPETSAPITRPLKSLDEVLSWTQGFDFFNVASVLLTEKSRKLEKRPRTLVCHDMKGGYLEDRFVQGTNTAPGDSYIIYHWQLIDIFVYFSHHFVTIPPPCWTNAAHTHGVPVLGTVITESEDGVIRCSKFLEDMASWKSLANQLVDIADYYRFDGWLLNIENPIQPVQINNLEEFVKYLTAEMHQRIPNSLVIWYDSVTYKGDLAWQDELNAKNRIFFDASDGIFLNYNWSEAHLMRSAGAAGHNRVADVYVGVDVFGRGCFGGGGYNSKLAFKVIREEKLSAALFAPGWVLETQGSKNFFVNQDKFWNLLAPYCTVRSAVKEIPFVTSTCRGCGKTANIDGKVVLSKPWTNLSAQQYQPTFINTFFNLGAKGGLAISAVEYTMDDAYNGGGCLLIAGHAHSTPEMSKGVVRLFKTNFQIMGPLLVSFTFKLDLKDCIDVALQLHTNKMPTYLLFCPLPSVKEQDPGQMEDSDLNNKLIRRYGIPESRTLTSSVFTSPIGSEHYTLFEPLSGDPHQVVQQAFGLREYDETGTSSEWLTRHYLIAGKELEGCTVQEIRLLCTVSPGAKSTGTFKLHLGEIKIVDPKVLKHPLASVRNIRCLDLIWKPTDQGYSLSLTLVWNCPMNDGQFDKPVHYNVFRATEDSNLFLGRAFVEAYRVCQLPVSKNCSSVEFVVQILTQSGLKKPLQECNRFKLNW